MNHSEEFHNEQLEKQAKELLETGMDFTEIEEALLKQGDNDILVAVVITKVKKEYYAAKRKKGVTKLGIASLFLLTGFVLTLANYNSNQSFTMVMYGFTSAGLLIMFWGLYEIIG